MPANSAATVMDRLRRVAGQQGGDDAALVERFRLERDEAAFAQIVRIHGPMVLGVCRRLLGNRADAEDAFQAAFIVLARKAGSIRNCSSLGSWLHAVAYRASVEARSARSRRQRFETQVDTLPDMPAPSAAEFTELRTILDGELNRLPERYRAPVVLCELEGRPRADAAKQLGIPEGTLSSRLALARKKLAAQLRARGLELGTTAFALVLPAIHANAQLLAETTRAAVFGNPAPFVTAITQGVLNAMNHLKLKLSALVLAPILGISAIIVAAPSSTPEYGPAPRIVAVAVHDEEEEQREPAVAKEAEKSHSVKNVRPVVVKTVPQAGADDVDPNLKEIRVTFSKEMMDQSWSWSGADEGDTPKTTGKPAYDKEKRTCVLPVQLEPGKTYAYWLNSGRFTNFKDTDGRSAVPYLLVFQTKGK